METVDRSVYLEDVRLQMEAKLWGEEYNRHRPPKQVQEKHSHSCAVVHDTCSHIYISFSTYFSHRPLAQPEEHATLYFAPHIFVLIFVFLSF